MSVVCCHTPELLGWNQHGIGFSMLAAQPVSLILWIQWGVWLCIFGMRFLFQSLIILQRLLFGFHQGRVPFRSIYCSGCSLNPFLSLSAGLTWLCQTYQSSSLVFVAEKTVSSVASGVPQALRWEILVYLCHLGGNLLQMCLSPCGYIINSAKKYPGLETIPALSPFQMWRVLDMKGALGFAVLVKKESMKQGINLSNIHVLVVSSRWELWRKAIVEERNSHKLPCVALLSGPVGRSATRRGLPGKEGLLGLRFIHCWLKKKKKPQTLFHIDLGEFEIQAALGTVCSP